MNHDELREINRHDQETKSQKVLDMVDEELKNVSRVKDSRMDTIEKGARIIPHYTHKTIRLGWFRFSFYKLGNKFTLRIELSKGWE